MLDLRKKITFFHGQLIGVHMQWQVPPLPWILKDKYFFYAFSSVLNKRYKFSSDAYLICCYCKLKLAMETKTFKHLGKTEKYIIFY